MVLRSGSKARARGETFKGLPDMELELDASGCKVEQEAIGSARTTPLQVSLSTRETRTILKSQVPSSYVLAIHRAAQAGTSGMSPTSPWRPLEGRCTSCEGSSLLPDM